MTNAMFRFSVKWAGSNMKIASLLRIDATNPVEVNSIQLQEQVGARVNIDPHDIKILLHSPAGPQLTPVLFTSALVRADTKSEDLSSHKAMIAAWSSLKTGQVYNVYVTQHSPVALAVDQMARLFRSGNYDNNAYNNLPITLQCNPVVALAALDVNDCLHCCLPDELRNNKKFALAAISQTRTTCTILGHLSSALRDDKEVVLKAVARDAHETWNASTRLLSSKSFVQKAESVARACKLDGCRACRSRRWLQT